MNSRTALIFIVFIVTAVVGAVFSYFYRGYTTRLVSDYAEQITTCGVITDEMNCLAKVYCEGIYNTDASGRASFTKCERIPDNIIEQNTKEQKLCEDTGGIWHKNRFGTSCVCGEPGARVAFDKTVGCLVP